MTVSTTQNVTLLTENTEQKQIPKLYSKFNNLDPDQTQQNVGPDLDPNCLTLMVFLKKLSENVIL